MDRPALLSNISFAEAKRGYDRGQVDNFLRELSVKVSELQDLLRQSEQRADRAEARLGEVDAAGPGANGDARVLTLAENAAATILRDAQALASELLTDPSVTSAVADRPEPSTRTLAISAIGTSDGRWSARDADAALRDAGFGRT